ncbi:MAG: serpin family protein [Labilithrix sp.]|nr:serpin family protein [Labilithrix sp.]
MLLPRVPSWVLPFGLALAGCDGAAPSRTSAAAKGQPADVPPLTTATTDPSPPVKSEELPGPAAANGAPIANAELSADVRNANAFTFKALARMKKPTDNAMISGTSVRNALGITYLGARGSTAREMATALGLDNDANVAARLARAELDAWQDSKGGAELNIATRLWIDDDFAIQPAFAKTAETSFGAAPASVDFAKSEDARKAINTWVAEKTKDKIPDLLPQGAVDARTRLVVTNAIWFKGRWEFPFRKPETKDGPFKTDGKKSVTVPLMHQTDSLRVATEPGLKVLELRYADSQLAMLVVLPDDPQPSALAKVEASLDPDTVDKWTAALATARVNVTLPRFVFRSGGAMNTPLQELGMKTAFTDKADFSGIADPHASERLFVSQVIHQTWISVDELGTEAAAATAATMRTTSMITGPVVEFRADHPFLFLIHDTKHGRLLFAGRVTNPKSP